MARTSYSALLAKAQEAGVRRDYPEAIRILTRIAAETDAIPEAWLFLGRARHAQGEHERAISAFSTYLGQKPDDHSGWFFLGRTYLAVGRAREAAACLRAAIDKGRSNAESWAMLGFAELKLKRSAKAVASLERAVSLAPADARVFRAYLNALYVHALRTISRGCAGEALGMIDFVIANGLDGPSQRLYKSMALRREGRPREALAELEEAMRYSPDDQALYLQAATLRFALGDTEGAMAAMERSGARLPEREGGPWTASAVERWQVLAALKRGDYKSALAAALDRIRSGETDAAIRAVAAQAYYELGRYERAAAHYRRASEADPGSPDLRLGLALCLWELGDYPGARAAAKAASARGASRDDASYVETLCDVKAGADPARTLPSVQALLRLRPGEPRLMLALGECLYKTGRPELAEAWFEDVLVVWPQHELAMLYLVSIAESLGDPEQARSRYAAYLSAYPDNAAVRRDYIDLLVDRASWREAALAIEEGYAYGAPRGYDGLLAVCYRNSGRYHEAAGLYRALLRADPRSVDHLLGLSYSLYKSGAKALAVELLERGSAFIGKSAEPYLALGVLRARQAEPEKAVAAFLRASELAPADPRPLRNLAKLYARAGVTDTAKHFEARAEALESEPRKRKNRKTG